MSFAGWLVVGALMLLCGLAMARMMWMADGRPPLRRPKPQPLDASREDQPGRDERHEA